MTRVLFAFVVAALVPAIRAQMAWPVIGQGIPPEGTTVVTSNVYVDSMRTVNSDRNSFSAAIWFHLTWNDTRAEQALQSATEAWVTNNTCNKACDPSGHQAAGCCDSIWLPHIESPNLVALDQEAVYSYRIWLDPTPGVSGRRTTVHWATKITAEWHSPFDFRAYPFEHQHLLLEFQPSQVIADRVALVIQDVGLLETTPHSKGEFAPGWFVSKITKLIFNSQACQQKIPPVFSRFNINSTGTVELQSFNSAPSAFEANRLQFQFTESNVSLGECHPESATHPDLIAFPEAFAQYGRNIVLVDMMIKRVKGFYILSNIIPLLLLTYMVFVTYAMKTMDLEARMGVIVALVLSVSALQFTWSFPPASYLNTVQQLTLVAYVLYFVVAIESMITAHICRYHERKKEKAQIVAVLHDPAGALTLTRSNSINSQQQPQQTLKNHESWRDRGVDAEVSLGTNASAVLQTPHGQRGVSTRAATSCLETVSENLTRTDSDAPMLHSNTSTHLLPTATKESRAQVKAATPGARNGATSPGPIAEGYEAKELSMQSKLKTKPALTIALGTDVHERSDCEVGVTSTKGPARAKGATSPSAVTTTPAAGSNARTLKKSKSSLSSFKDRASNIYTRHVKGSISQMARTTRTFSSQLSKDEAFALMTARRIDVAVCWGLLMGYTVVWIVLLAVNSMVGDHKLMLNGRPANM